MNLVLFCSRILILGSKLPPRGGGARGGGRGSRLVSAQWLGFRFLLVGVLNPTHLLTYHGGSVKRPDEEERSLLRAVARAAQDRTKAQQRRRNAHALAPNTGKHLRHEEGLG